MTAQFHHLAQVNIARAKAPVDSPQLAEFKALLDPINELAERSPGFVWRLKDEDDGDATSIAFPGAGEETIVNMSVWETAEDLWEFVYDSDHLDVMRRRREWFDATEDFMCLWWIPVGSIPTVEEARRRLDLLAANGPTPDAFTFKLRFNSAGTPLAGTPRRRAPAR